MGRFLTAAQQVLTRVKKPLSAKEIVDFGLENGLLQTGGKTPSQTMKSKLSTDILQKRDHSLFMRTSQGKFALRSWLPGDEYFAKRFKKSLLDEDVLVFPQTSLHRYVRGIGLQTTQIRSGKELIAECYPMTRRLAEEDSNVIQLVSAFIIRYSDQYLTYKRTRRLPEARLHHFYSVPFGGHLNPEDMLPFFDFFDFENAHFMLTRELQEELKLPKYTLPDISYKGLLYDNSQEVSCHHLGVVYDVYLKSPEYEIGERGFLMDPRFETLSEIEARISDFENWSVLIVNFERQIMKSINKSQ